MSQAVSQHCWKICPEQPFQAKHRGHLASEVEKEQRQVSEMKNRVADVDSGVICSEERNCGAL